MWFIFHDVMYAEVEIGIENKGNAKVCEAEVEDRRVVAIGHKLETEKWGMQFPFISTPAREIQIP